MQGDSDHLSLILPGQGRPSDPAITADANPPRADEVSPAFLASLLHLFCVKTKQLQAIKQITLKLWFLNLTNANLHTTIFQT